MQSPDLRNSDRQSCRSPFPLLIIMRNVQMSFLHPLPNRSNNIPQSFSTITSLLLSVHIQIGNVLQQEIEMRVLRRMRLRPNECFEVGQLVGAANWREDHGGAAGAWKFHVAYKRDTNTKGSGLESNNDCGKNEARPASPYRARDLKCTKAPDK